MTTTYSPFQQGAVVQVAQGVLRGVGPMGPRGFTGPQGAPGPQGPRGLQPAFEPVAAQYSRTQDITLTNDGNWQRVQLTTNSYNAGNWTAPGSGVNDGMVVITSPSADGAATLFTATGVFVPDAVDVDRFTVEIGIFAGSSPSPWASSVYTHNVGDVAGTHSFSAQVVVPGVGGAYGVGVRVLDATLSPHVTHMSLSLANTGGPRGTAGPQGNVGPAGPAGPQGPAGNAGDGYATLDGIDAGGDASDGTGITLSTNDQGLPFPAGTDAPKSVFFHKSMADEAAKRVVRRFATSGEEGAATDREVGQVFYQQSTKSVHVLTADGNGDPVSSTVAQVVWSTEDPPATAYPAGTIWLKVV